MHVIVLKSLYIYGVERKWLEIRHRSISNHLLPDPLADSSCMKSCLSFQPFPQLDGQHGALECMCSHNNQLAVRMCSHYSLWIAHSCVLRPGRACGVVEFPRFHDQTSNSKRFTRIRGTGSGVHISHSMFNQSEIHVHTISPSVCHSANF